MANYIAPDFERHVSLTHLATPFLVVCGQQDDAIEKRVLQSATVSKIYEEMLQTMAENSLSQIGAICALLFLMVNFFEFL